MNKSFIAAALAPLILTPVADGLTLQDFIECIGTNGKGTVCQLDAGTYQIDSTLLMGRSNITIKGTTLTSRGDTLLRRAPGFQRALLRDVFYQTVEPTWVAVTLRDLTIDGNRAQNPAVFSSYEPEVDFFSTKSILVTNCDFINSPNISLALHAAGTGGVVVNNSHFGNPVVYGLWSDAIGTHPQLEAPNGFQLCTSLNLVNDIVVANSVFENGGESVITFNAKNIQIINNVFRNNKSNTLPFNDSGGQIDLSVCTDDAAVFRNTFKDSSIGPNGMRGSGIELHGTNLAIVDNLIVNNSGCGVGTDGVQDVFVANWDPSTEVANNQLSGICIYHSSGFRPDESITIDMVDSISNANWGIWTDTADLPIKHVRILNNCLKENAWGPWGPTYLRGLGSDAVIQNNSVSGCGPN